MLMPKVLAAIAIFLAAPVFLGVVFVASPEMRALWPESITFEQMWAQNSRAG